MTLPPPPPPSHHSSFYTSFPILAISILGILTTAILLLSYYIFVIKCCLSWRRSHLLFRLSPSSSSSRSPRFHHRPTVLPTPPQGLDPATINSIPTLRFSKQHKNSTAAVATECAVCLTDFREQELLRLLPNCSHAFHIDCIDTWLHSHLTCPLCRSPITPFFFFFPHPFSSPHINVVDNDDDDDVRIEIRGDDVTEKVNKLWRNVGKSMGDEFIDSSCRRDKDETFVVQQPIRRSFSMDSSNDRQLYLSVQQVLSQNPHLLFPEPNTTFSSTSTSNANGRIRRSFFSFGRSTRSASVLPLQTEDHL